jgi:hypothetical protein
MDSCNLERLIDEIPDEPICNKKFINLEKLINGKQKIVKSLFNLGIVPFGLTSIENTLSSFFKKVEQNYNEYSKPCKACCLA